MRNRVYALLLLLILSGVALYISKTGNSDLLFDLIAKISGAPDDSSTATIYTKEELERSRYKKRIQFVSEAKQWMARQKIPESKWLEGEKKAYAEILGSTKFNAVVIPFSAPSYDVDLTELSLMTRYFQWGLEQSSKYQFPNQTFVERALGQNEREYNNERLTSFAKENNVDILIWGEVNKNENNDLVVSIHVAEDINTFKKDDIQTVELTLNKYSDITPPSQAFAKRLNEVIALSGIQTIGDVKRVRYPAIGNVGLPKKFDDLFTTGNNNPVEAAYKLQLIATLQPKTRILAKRRLFERSLVILSGVSEDSPDYRLLKARALFHLFRRPAASVYMAEASTPEERAFRAYIDGNSVDAKIQTAFIQSDLKKIIAAYELHGLRNSYSAPKHEFYKAYKDVYPDYLFYLYSSYNDTNKWELIDSSSLKLKLEKLYPLDGSRLETVIRGKLALGKLPDSADIDILSINHVKEALDKYKSELCCSNNNWYLSKMDHLDLLDGLNVSNTMKRVNFYLSVQGRHEAAFETILKYEPVLSGHPKLSMLKAKAIMEKAEKSPAHMKKSLWAQSAQLSLHALYWDKGNTGVSGDARSMMRDLSTRGVVAYNNNSHTSTEYLSNVYKDGDISFPFDLRNPNYETVQLRRIEYLQTGIEKLSQLLNEMRKHGEHDEAKELLEKYSYRFVGDPQRTVLYADLKLREGDTDAAAQLYLNAVNRNSTDWAPYAYLAQIYAAEMRYEDAMNVYLKYPGFNDKSLKLNRVGLSNTAYYAGRDLFWRGAYSQAKPLYEISASYETGSSAGINSAMRLALLEQNYAKAAQIARIRATRYNNSYSYRDYMSLLHTLGYSNDAWALFENVVETTDDPYVWDAAYIGQRKEGAGEEAILDWINTGNKSSLMKDRHNLSARYLFMALAIDRPAHDNLASLVERQGLKNKNSISKQHYNEWEFKNNRYVRLAEVYNALKNNDYIKINNIFDNEVFINTRKFEASKYALPYYCIAASLTGNTKNINQYLNAYYTAYQYQIDVEVQKNQFDEEEVFEYELARSVLFGLSNKHDEAIKSLHKAFSTRPYTEMRPMFTWYQIVEISELLYDLTKEDRYRLIALEWSRQFQVIQPQFAWAYAVEAKYTKNEQDRIRALGMALYLDKASERISDIDESTKEKARKWMKSHNPFKISSSGV